MTTDEQQLVSMVGCFIKAAGWSPPPSACSGTSAGARPLARAVLVLDAVLVPGILRWLID